MEFNKAIAKAVALTNPEETLIVVTSDHSHVLAYNGYSSRGHDILGRSGDRDARRVPYMTLSYTNGPGFRSQNPPGLRPDVTQDRNFGNFL